MQPLISADGPVPDPAPSWMPLVEAEARRVRGDGFDRCLRHAVRLETALSAAGHRAQVWRLQGPLGHRPLADRRWLELDQEGWTHYVVACDGFVVDLTPRQFDRSAPPFIVEEANSFVAGWREAVSTGSTPVDVERPPAPGIRLLFRRSHLLPADPLTDAYASTLSNLVTELESDPAVQGRALPGKTLEIRVVMAGRREFAQYGVRKDAMGFHAISSPLQEDDDGQTWYEVSDRHTVFICGDTMMSAVSDRYDMVAWFGTLPHEVMHALDWIEETGGQTPDDLYVRCEEQDEDWEPAVRRILAAIDRKHSSGGGTEGAVEEWSRRWIDSRENRILAMMEGMVPGGKLGVRYGGDAGSFPSMTSRSMQSTCAPFSFKRR